jgi:glucose/arabinose dehydrogenase
MNRLSRFKTVKGVGANEKILIDNIPSDTGSHDGGALFFGADDKLYLGIGDGGYYWGDAQFLNNLRGKVLRLKRNGKTPPDNPYYQQADTDDRIYSYGFRNPFRGVKREANGTNLIGDVGEVTWEEINNLQPRGDYGWYRYEGPCPFDTPNCPIGQTDFGVTTGPIHYYNHNGTGEKGGTVILGAFPGNTNYPKPYKNALFYGDWVRGWVHVLSLDKNNQVKGHAEFDELPSPVDFETGPDGNIYVLTYFPGKIYKYIYVGN